MKSGFDEYTDVEIVKLNRRPEDYNGWGWNKYSPMLGEHGTIVHIFEKDNQMVYVVEGEDVNGEPPWLGVFTEDEIRPLEKVK
ncbi:MAG: hypothetical protein WCS42_07550 [Verrucomicrobiota bacterium]